MRDLRTLTTSTTPATPTLRIRSSTQGTHSHTPPRAHAGDSEEEKDPETIFKREVAETFLRCVKMKFDQVGCSPPSPS